MVAPAIIAVNPASGAVSVPTNVSIYVIFNQEIDTYRLKNGGVFLEGPDESKSIGPGFLDLQPPMTDEDEFLSSPGLKGIKGCTFQFLRVDGSGNTVNYYDYGETGDAGQIYRTKVVLTPNEPLAATTVYTIHIVGDEDLTDSYEFGLTTRSVFDPRKGPNTGNGEVDFYGGYTGDIRKQYFVEITTAGASGTAQYEWWTNIDTTHRVGVSGPGYRLLEDGVRVRFIPGLVFQPGDTFSVWCDVPEYMDGSYVSSFTTSSYEAETVPASSTLLTGTGAGAASAAAEFSVLSTDPEDRESFVSTSLTSVRVTFSAVPLASTVTGTTVTVEGHAADGSVSGIPQYTETLSKTLALSGSTLTITLAASQLYSNNIIVVTLDDSISDSNGNTLGSDYVFFFTTTLTPFYGAPRLVRLRLGSVGNSIPEDTINLAIWDASRHIDVLTPGTITSSDSYSRARLLFANCMAAWILLSSGGSLASGSVRKRLADFDVSRSEGGVGRDLEKSLQDCVDFNERVLLAGGLYPPNLKPRMGVKGDLNVNEPLYGRGWETPSTPIMNDRVLYYGSRRWLRTNVGRT
jgi:hypothetical protein